MAEELFGNRKVTLLKEMHDLCVSDILNIHFLFYRDTNTPQHAMINILCMFHVLKSKTVQRILQRSFNKY